MCITQIPATTSLRTLWSIETNDTLHIPTNVLNTSIISVSDNYSILFTGNIDTYYFIKAYFQIYDEFGNSFNGANSQPVSGYYLSNTYTYRIELSDTFRFPKSGFGWARSTSSGRDYLGYMPPPPNMNGLNGIQYNGDNIGGGDTNGMTYTRLRFVVLDVLPSSFTSSDLPTLIADTLFENDDINDASPELQFSQSTTILWQAVNLTNNVIVRFRATTPDSTIPLYLTAYYSVS
jgi:hypothetical protein